MKIKRIITGLMALTMAASSMAMMSGCSQSSGGQSYMENGDKVYVYKFNMYTQDDTKYPETRDNEFDRFLHDVWKIDFEYDRIPRTDWETKTNVRFATNDAPDITTGGKEPDYKRWKTDEMLVPVAEDYDEFLEKFPNYSKLFGENMKEVYDLAASEDGKLYYLPSVRQEKAQMCWLYREDIIKSLLDENGNPKYVKDGKVQYPKTTDEFLQLCKDIKAKYPDSVIITSNGQKMSSLTGFYQAFGIPELIMSTYSYVERDGTFIPYALTTDNAREMFKFIRELHEMGAIDNEILSMEKETFNKRCATNNAMITYNYIYNADSFTKQTIQGTTEDVKNGKWVYTPNMLTNDTARGTVYKRDPLYSNWGPAFTVSSVQDSNKEDHGKLDKVLSLYDWFASDEGTLYTSYGIRGTSYDLLTIDEYKDTEKDKIDKKLKDDLKPIGEELIAKRKEIRSADGKSDEEKNAEIKAAEDEANAKIAAIDPKTAESNAKSKKKIDDMAIKDDWCFVYDPTRTDYKLDWSDLTAGEKYVPVVKTEEGWYHQIDNKDKKAKKINEHLGMFSQVFLKHPKMFYETRGKDIEVLYKEFQEKEVTENYYSIPAVAMRYQSDEQQRLTDYTTALDTKRDEYIARFLIGDMDPNNDDHWNQYIKDMERVGLRKFEELQTTVYNRTKADMEAEALEAAEEN